MVSIHFVLAFDNVGSHPLRFSILQMCATNFIQSTITKTLVSQKTFYLEFTGETARTSLIDALQYYLKARGNSFVAVAAPVIAAKTNNSNRTARLAFKSLVSFEAVDTCYIFVDTNDPERLRKVFLLIWDDILRCHRLCIEALACTLTGFL